MIFLFLLDNPPPKRPPRGRPEGLCHRDLNDLKALNPNLSIIQIDFADSASNYIPVCFFPSISEIALQ